MLRIHCIHWRSTDLDAAQRLLDDAERVRADRYRINEARERFVACRALLKTVIAAELKIAPHHVAIQTAANGKPRLAGGIGEISFNQSHSGDWLLMVTARPAPSFEVGDVGDVGDVGEAGEAGEVGCDLECFRAECSYASLDIHFSPREQQAVTTSVEPERTRHRLWVCKEAVAKATGDPQPYDFASSLDFLDRITQPPLFGAKAGITNVVQLRCDASAQTKHWRLAELDLGSGFSAAVCWDSSDEDVRFDLSMETRSPLSAG